MPPGSAKAFGIVLGSTCASSGCSMPPAVLSFSIIVANAALPSGASQTLSPNNGAHLHVDRLAHPLLDRSRNQRRQPIGGKTGMP